MNHNLERIECGYRARKRAGDFIVQVFKKHEKYLTAEECLKLRDSYGIRPEDVAKMAISHEFDIDKQGFAKLLDEDDERRKGMILLKCLDALSKDAIEQK
jgi:alanyl-tRNA synthetase